MTTFTEIDGNLYEVGVIHL